MKALRSAGGPVTGVVAVPGSKSIANRALVAAALADGQSRLTNVPDGDDTVAMVGGIEALGVGVATGNGGDVEAGDAGTVVVTGRGGRVGAPAAPLHAGLAGTTARFLTAVAALGSAPITIDGDAHLQQRPMVELHEALAALGADVHRHGERGLPVTVTGPMRGGGTVRLPGDVSSQFVTALMLIAPLLDGGLRIELTSTLVSLPYVRLTAAVMASFGVDGVAVADRSVVVPSGTYRATRYDVEPDASAASYPLAIAAVCGGEVVVPGITTASQQGDVAIVELLAAMGCDVDGEPGSLRLRRPAGVELRGIDADLAAASDLVPTIAAVAVTATTPSTISGVGFIRAKESDRLGDLAGELVKTGARVVETADGLHIEPAPGGAAGLHGARLLTHHDHRLAMAFAVLGAAVPGITVDDPTVVSKTWPGFWDAYDALVGNR